MRNRLQIYMMWATDSFAGWYASGRDCCGAYHWLKDAGCHVDLMMKGLAKTTERRTSIARSNGRNEANATNAFVKYLQIEIHECLWKLIYRWGHGHFCLVTKRLINMDNGWGRFRVTYVHVWSDSESVSGDEVVCFSYSLMDKSRRHISLFEAGFSCGIVKRCCRFDQ